jgi:hypothetical protein
LVTVNYDDTAEKALTLMKEKNFSQLPVRKKGRIIGAISFASMVKKLSCSCESLNFPFSKIEVRELMEKHPTVSEEEDLFDLFDRLADESFLLVKMKNQTDEIITSYDALMYFRVVAEDFVVLNDIENNFRKTILSEFTERAFKERARLCFAGSKIPSKVSDMTFGGYIIFFEKNWEKFEQHFREIDDFISRVHAAKNIRNKVCHFNGPISNQDKAFLRLFLEELEAKNCYHQAVGLDQSLNESIIRSDILRKSAQRDNL